MGINIESADGNCMVTIEEDMTIYEAVNQKDVLLRALKSLNAKEQMEIDLANVNVMDTAGLQILLLIKNVAVNSEKTVLLVEHSPATLDVIDRYNLAAYFGDPMMITSVGH